MSGVRPRHHTQFEVWVTREASAAINEAAEKQDITRSQYIQNAIWDGIDGRLRPTDLDDRLALLPVPRHTRRDLIRYAAHRPGYKGRWAMWVRARCTMHSSMPMILTWLSIEDGDGSASAFTRRLLSLAIERDLGRKVPMPSARKPTDLFGGKIHEVVL